MGGAVPAGGSDRYDNGSALVGEPFSDEGGGEEMGSGECKAIV